MLNNEDLPPASETRRLPSPDRHSAPTPLDVRQAKFSTAMRGYERAEVNAFLLEAADGYEQATRENERLRQDVARLEASLTQYRELEGALKGALMSAQKVSDDMKETASLDAARIIREAEGRAELITQKAQAVLEDVQREIDGLRLKRRESEVALESIIAALHNTLDFVREQDQRDQHRVIPHRPSTIAQLSTELGMTLSPSPLDVARGDLERVERSKGQGGASVVEGRPTLNVAQSA